MKILVALMTCGLHEELGFHDAIRATWGSDVRSQGWDLRFFVGRSVTPLKDDMIRFDVPDNKETLTYKVAAICRWMVDNGYDRMLKVNTNTYVNVPLLAAEGNWQGVDWCGAQVGRVGEWYGDCGIHGWIQGSGNWMSARASRIVADEVVNYALGNMARLMRWNGIIAPYLHSEDLWIAQVLTPRLHELSVAIDGRYADGPLTYWSQSNYIKSYCLSEWFHAMHAVRPDHARLNSVLAEYRSKG